jgi:hypothetical protein
MSTDSVTWIGASSRQVTQGEQAKKTEETKAYAPRSKWVSLSARGKMAKSLVHKYLLINHQSKGFAIFHMFEI